MKEAVMFTLALLTILLAAPIADPPSVPPFTLAVEGAGDRGTLAFTADGIDFTARTPAKSRRWSYSDLKQIRVASPRRVVLDTFEDRSRWRLGQDRSVEFDVTEAAIDAELVSYLLVTVARPIVTAVMPAGLGEPVARIPAKHVRWGQGSHGTVALHATGLAYAADLPADSRFWRFQDVQSVFQPSPFELLVTVYEGGSTRTFSFALKAPMPAGAFDTLWQRVNPPAGRTGGAR